MKRHQFLTAMGLAVFFVFTFSGCDLGGSSNGDGGSCPNVTLDISVCDPDTVTFSTTIDNEWFPLSADTELILEGVDDGETIRVEITVEDNTEMVAGVETLVMVETEYEDGELVEVSRNFIAQAADGTVCYFGEDVNDYDDGQLVGHEGQWRAGENGYQPGILMPASPQVGDTYYQEYAPGAAEDMGSVIAFGDPISVPAGDFTDTMTMEDCNPLEDAETDEKVYVRGIGLAIDEEAELISY
jgi:hypothetical protein